VLSVLRYLLTEEPGFGAAVLADPSGGHGTQLTFVSGPIRAIRSRVQDVGGTGSAAV
jgi:hypothetical protein